MEKDVLKDNTKYLPIEAIVEEINANFKEYFKKIFNFEKDSQLPKDKFKNALGRTLVENKISEWEEEITEYNKSFNQYFSPEKLEIYESILDDFKNKNFGVYLWTVRAALRTPDPDLARYKRDFGDAFAEDILDTLKQILSYASNYISGIGQSIDYRNINNIQDLKLEFLDRDDLFLKRIIGFGIRSEILHRKYPANFPIMTQKSIWGMYFLTSVTEEFIAIEKKVHKGKIRVTHNWVYNFARFTYYNNIICNLLYDKLKADFNITLKPELWFGYSNMFLSEINKINKEDIQLLHEWSNFEK